MESKINIKRNKLLYPFQKFLDCVVHVLFLILKSISPTKYKNQISDLENNNTISNIIGLTLFNAFGGFLLMLTNIKLANVLGAALYGIYSYYAAIGEVGINFVRYGRDKSMIRDLIQQPEQYNSLVSNTFVLSLVNLLAFSIVIFSLSGPLDIDISIASISIIIATCLISLDLQPVYESIRMMSWHSLYTILQRLFFLVLIWIPLIFTNNASLTYIGLSLLFTWCLILFIQYKEVISQLNIKISEAVSFTTLIRLYKSNFLIALSCILGVAFGPLIRLILKNYVDETAVGLYAACFQIFLLSKFILTQISRVGNPMMAEAGKKGCSKERRRVFIKKYIVIMFIGAIPFVIPMIFFPGLIVDFCFTEEYYEIRNYVPLFGVYLLAMAVGNVYEQFLISMRADKIYFGIYVSCSILTIISSLVLIPYYGVLGGVYAFVIPNVLARLLYFCFGEYIITSK